MSEHQKLTPYLEILAQDTHNKLAYLFWSFQMDQTIERNCKADD